MLTATDPVDRWLWLHHGVVDLSTGAVRVGERVDRLSRRETAMLRFLAERGGRAVTRDELSEQVIGATPTVGDRSVDSTIARLRCKIEEQPTRPEHLISVFNEGYRFEPSLRARAVERSGVPPERTSLVGREGEIAAVLTALAVHRVVVVTGPGGVGKTRLASRIAGEVVAERVVFVSLAHTATLGDAVGEVARGIGAPIQGSPSLEAATGIVGRSLVGGTVCLVLDNVEQLDGVASLVDAWLLAAPDLRILVTSRGAVGAADEHVVRIGCLAPEAAAALYAERAAAVGATFGPSYAESLGLLVARLDHLPLAIELAAARARSLTPSQMLDRIGPDRSESRLRLLSAGPRDSEPRLTSVAAMLDWSWELLPAGDRDALARSAVFVGRITAPAARAVLGDGSDEALARLVSASLLQEVDDGWVLLETVRTWAHGKADALGVRLDAEVAHAAYHADWLADAFPSWSQRLDRVALDRLERELPHLLAVPARMERVRPDLAARVVLVLWEWFQLRGAVEPYLEVLECAIRGARAADLPELPRVLRTRAMVLRALGRRAETERDLQEATDRTTDPVLRAQFTCDAAELLIDVGRFDQAATEFERVLPSLSGYFLGLARGSLAALPLRRGDTSARTEAMLRSALDAECGAWPQLKTWMLGNLGVLLTFQHRAVEADVVLVETIAALRVLGAVGRLPGALLQLADARILQGRFDDADALAAEAEELARRGGPIQDHGSAVATRGALQLVFGDLADGIRRIDEADRRFESIADRLGQAILEAFRAVLLAASDLLPEARGAAERATARLAEQQHDGGLVAAVDGHLAWAEARSGIDVDRARQRVVAARQASAVDPAAWFFLDQLPDDRP